MDIPQPHPHLGLFSCNTGTGSRTRMEACKAFARGVTLAVTFDTKHHPRYLLVKYTSQIAVGEGTFVWGCLVPPFEIGEGDRGSLTVLSDPLRLGRESFWHQARIPMATRDKTNF